MEQSKKDVIDGFIGTYDSEDSRGIYHFTFQEESGELTAPELFYEAGNAKWVTVDPDSIVFPVERKEGAGTCFLTTTDGKIEHADEILEEKETPCYILKQQEMVYTANYHEGAVMVYDTKTGRPEIVKRIENGVEAGCHQIIPYGQYLLVPCLTQHKIRLFDRTKGFEEAGELRFPEGSGPRHGVFNRDYSRFYVVSEWSNELFVFQVQGIEFEQIQRLPLLPDERETKGSFTGASAAAVHLTRDQRFLYVSVRGMDLLVVFEIREDRAVCIQHTDCGGEHPRDFILSRNEKYLLVANRSAGGIVSIERDERTGLLLGIRSRIGMAEAVSLALAPQELYDNKSEKQKEIK